MCRTGNGPKVRILLLPLKRKLGRHGVCVGLKILLMWFESTSFHNIYGVSSSKEERPTVTREAVGSNPTFLPTMLS